MTVVHVFDPAMCCSTGICGPSIDPKLARFSADLDWLKSRGVSVERFNLSQQPAAFAADAAVKSALEISGEAGLPVVKVNGAVKISGSYPSRDELAKWAGIGGSDGENHESAEGPTKTAGCCEPNKTEAASAEKKSGCC